MKKFFAALTILTSVAGGASAEDVVFYCVSELSTGFTKKDGTWSESSFTPSRKTVKFSPAFDRLIWGGALGHEYRCKPGGRPNTLICQIDEEERAVNILLYDKSTGRYVRSQVHEHSYLKGLQGISGGDWVTAGKCEKF